LAVVSEVVVAWEQHNPLEDRLFGMGRCLYQLKLSRRTGTQGMNTRIYLLVLDSLASGLLGLVSAALAA
jgi:hypothetical protein